MTERHLNFWDFIDYVQRNSGMLLGYLYAHILMVLIGVGLAFIVGVPLGALCTRNRIWERLILTVTNILQVVPSLAMLVLLLLIMGLGSSTVTVGLFLYSLNPIVRNTFVGLKQVNPSYVEAGRGVGMSRLQILFQIRFPLALTYMMTGLRISAVIAIGVATIAPLIGGNGLGREIYAGINNGNSLRIFAGAIPAALLAIVADLVLGTIQRKLKFEGRRSKSNLPPPKAQG
ncbi:glycine betaine/carnitine/choline transport system permease protein OpuCD [Paenibacillus baekrokdamisoli]|uniref:Glycine betaine/carnitine/choline transport system permease protein OpuCD n=1 Tax=Paenibacillus baekrokdamisoli TaxID=1712516 RepID=A0A3G9J8T6_9BACL|nr:ABC transporter permease [Paenibacillus baekrokdamisoli]MBB3067355.1 osmoprotectant transport system permease protein [Paenibacillus baekrokdamisoli]BBH19459.1 glycine betaine/carnitine/choline transport system permease protein OpuCD [Paenibacillus baekrokdamisoli]